MRSTTAFSQPDLSCTKIKRYWLRNILRVDLSNQVDLYRSPVSLLAAGVSDPAICSIIRADASARSAHISNGTSERDPRCLPPAIAL